MQKFTRAMATVTEEAGSSRGRFSDLVLFFLFNSSPTQSPQQMLQLQAKHEMTRLPAEVMIN